jgi:predicted ArsR family transcriptional regulator
MSSSSLTRNSGKIFTDKAVDFLINNAGVLSAKSIAGRLGRTTKAVRRKAEKLGLSLSL